MYYSYVQAHPMSKNLFFRLLDAIQSAEPTRQILQDRLVRFKEAQMPEDSLDSTVAGNSRWEGKQ